MIISIFYAYFSVNLQGLPFKIIIVDKTPQGLKEEISEKKILMKLKYILSSKYAKKNWDNMY